MPLPWLKPFQQHHPQTQFSPPPPPPTSAEPHKDPFLTIQSHLNSFFSRFPVNPSSSSSSSSSSPKPYLQSLADRSLQSLQSTLARFAASQKFPDSPPAWAWLSLAPAGCRRLDLAALPTSAIEERLGGVPVYALSNAAEEFVLVSGTRTGKRLCLLCFKKEDADALLAQMRSVDKGMREGSKVVPVALNKVVQLKVDGIAVRFIPDSSQVANAIKEKEKEGDCIDGFSGVPVFQSRSLVLRSQNKRYRPVFFRKEDLDDSLFRASRQQMQLNPALRKGDIQVCVLEDIVKAMRETSASPWDDVVFIPPGFNVSTDLSETAQA